LQRIFVGDVQGCADELDELLARAEDRFGRAFELWVVGDLINRGPGNLRALRRVRERVEASRAHYVLGNHEIGLIATALGVRPLSPFDTFHDVLDAPDAADWLAWLRARPLVVPGQLGSQPFVMLHAAAPPGWEIDQLCERARVAASRLAGSDAAVAAWLREPDDPDLDLLGRLTRCRSVSASGRWSSEPPMQGDGSAAWHAHWAASDPHYAVVYGHWALQGLHVAPLLRGLDTGCVHHGRGREGLLTAWLPDPACARPFDVPDECFWQIPARRAYYIHRDTQSGVS
jgi:bis(5'-nucleosyl)-tetraphosphatase (symmetrical)